MKKQTLKKSKKPQKKASFIKQAPALSLVLKSKKGLIFALAFAVTGIGLAVYTYAAKLPSPTPVSPANGAVVSTLRH